MKSRKILLALIIAVSVVLLGLGVMHGKLFKLNKIEIIIDNQISENSENIIELCKLKKGQNILKINKDDIETAINASGTYGIDSISIIYPNSIKINIFTRIPSAIIEYNSTYIIIDKNVNAIKITENIEGLDIPLFTGVRISQYQIGNPIITKDPYQKSIIETVLNTIQEDNTSFLVHMVSLESLSNMYFIAPNGKKIDLCEAVDVSDKLSLLNEKKLQEAILNEENNTITLYKGYFAIS